MSESRRWSKYSIDMKTDAVPILPLRRGFSFQAAPSAAPTKQAASKPTPPPAQKAAGGDIFDFLGGDSGSSNSAPTSSVTSPALARPSTSSVLSPSSLRPTMQSASSSASLPASQQPARPSTSSKPAPSSGLSGFDDLWASSAGSKSGSSAAGSGKKTMADLAKEKSGAGVWGGGASSAGAQQQQKKDVFDFL